VQHLAPADARALRALRSKADDGPFVFVSERFRALGELHLTRDAFAKMLASVSERWD
jgi:hypothetical protein